MVREYIYFIFVILIFQEIVTDEATLQALIKTLSEIRPCDVYDECRYLTMAETINYRERPSLLCALYASATLTKVRHLTCLFCEGCRYVGLSGQKGHPSQHRHDCLMLTQNELLETCFTAGFMMVNRREVAKTFLGFY